MAAATSNNSSSNMLWTAQSPSSQSIVAVLDPNSNGGAASLRVSLLQTNNKSNNGSSSSAASLLMTLTHRPKQHSHDESDEQQLIRALFFANDSTLCLLTTRELVVWDVTRGVQAFALAAESGQSFLHGCTASNNDHQVLLLVQTSASSLKCQVHLYDTQSQKLVRKIKVGKAATSIAAFADQAILIRSQESVKLVASDTGSRLQKYEGMTASSSDHVASVAVVGNVGVTVSGHQLVVMNLRDGSSRKLELPPHQDGTTSLGSTMQLVALDGVGGDDDDSSCLLWYGHGLYSIEADKESLQLQCQLVVPGTSDTMHSWSLCLGVGQLVAVTKREDSNDFTVSTRTMDQVVKVADGKEASVWDLSPKTSDTTFDDSSKSTSKRKQAASILGPGQMGGEARGVSDVASKKAKLLNDDNADDMQLDETIDEDEDGDDDGPTVADRLAQLQKELDEESDQEDTEDSDGAGKEVSFNSKRATTESLSQLLQQALQSGDDQMLELALQVRDKKVIEESCLSLTSEQAAMLLAALTTRLAIKPGRADHMCAWLSVLLQTNKVTSIAHLQPLQNLLEERVEVFSSLLRLEGRLSMMSSK